MLIDEISATKARKHEEIFGLNWITGFLELDLDLELELHFART
jgi:hypothetical protein